jgi:pyridoxine 4-dehydrogenase
MTWALDPITDEVAFSVLREALANGANVWNGADFYGTPSANSLHLLNRYFTKYPEDADKVVLSIKSGVNDMRTFDMDVSPAGMRRFAEQCNKILDGKKKIDLFGPGRLDPKIPTEETIKGLGDLVDEGIIGGIQLSEVNATQIRAAHKVYKIDMVEEEISLWAPEIFSNGVAETCAELGIVLEAHSPLGAGMLTGKIQKWEDWPENDHHRFFPKWQGENFKKNLELVNEVKALAEKKGVSTAQLALNWIKRGNGKEGQPWIVTIPGGRSVERVRENCSEVSLSEGELEGIQKILESFPVVGARWPETHSGYNGY